MNELVKVWWEIARDGSKVTTSATAKRGLKSTTTTTTTTTTTASTA